MSKGKKVAKTTCLGNDKACEELEGFLGRAYQSSHINFLIGSGASSPAIGLAGCTEKEIQVLYETRVDDNIEKADRKKYEFLVGIQNPTNLLIGEQACCKNSRTTDNYKHLLDLISSILHERNTTLLPRQASIFTTNYDLFIEKAAERVPSVILNDGFARTPNLAMKYDFSPQYYFNATSNTGNLFNYRAEIPTINLLKMHGSLSWSAEESTVENEEETSRIVFRIREIQSLNENPSYDDVKEYLCKFYLVLPEYHKFRSAVIDQNYYELLRIYANELQRENCLLLVFGFSFADEHIRLITQRAMRNASLKVVIFAFSRGDVVNYARLFDGYHNVEIVAPSGDSKIGFAEFCKFLKLRPSSKSR